MQVSVNTIGSAADLQSDLISFINFGTNIGAKPTSLYISQYVY